ncbi:MAG: DUF2905 domain-containing protein [Armatimonadia bacterium]
MADQGASGLLLVGRAVLVAGLLIALLGAALMLMGRYGLHLRPLPGDIVIRRPGLVVYSPLVTMLVLSLAVTLILQLLAYLRR